MVFSSSLLKYELDIVKNLYNHFIREEKMYIPASFLILLEKFQVFSFTPLLFHTRYQQNSHSIHVDLNPGFLLLLIY